MDWESGIARAMAVERPDGSVRSFLWLPVPSMRWLPSQELVLTLLGVFPRAAPFIVSVLLISQIEVPNILVGPVALCVGVAVLSAGVGVSIWLCGCYLSDRLRWNLGWTCWLSAIVLMVAAVGPLWSLHSRYYGAWPFV